MVNLGVPYTGLPVALDIVNTREDEALAMAVGISLAGGEARVWMQDDGFLNTLNIVATLILPYRIEDIMQSVNWRKDLPHHIYANKIGLFLWNKLTERPFRI